MSTVYDDSLLCLYDRGESKASKKEIASTLRKAIEQGRISPGTCLPSVRNLAERLNVSRSTVYRGVEELISQGYLTALPGKRIQVPNHLRLTEKPPQENIGSRETKPADGSSCHDAYLVPTDDRAWLQLERLTIKHLREFRKRSFCHQADLFGEQQLRKAMAQYLRRSRNVNCQAAHVAVFSGARARHEVFCRLLINPGDRVAIEESANPQLVRCLLLHGAQIDFIPCDEEGILLSRLPEREVLKFVYVSPSVGQRPMSSVRRNELIDWTRLTGSYIIEDDSGCELRTGKDRLPALQSLDEYGSVIYFASTMSPLDSFLKVACAVIPDQLQLASASVKSVVDPQVPIIEQLVLTDFLESGYFDTAVARIRARAVEQSILEKSMSEITQSSSGQGVNVLTQADLWSRAMANFIA